MKNDSLAAKSHDKEKNPKIIPLPEAEERKKSDAAPETEEKPEYLMINGKKVIKFWKYEKRKLTINSYHLKLFSQDEGFYKAKIFGALTYIRCDGYIVNEIEIQYYSDYLLKFIENIPEETVNLKTKTDILDLLIRKKGEFFNARFYDTLETLEIDFLQDTLDTSWIFYKNGALQVTADSTELIGYSELKKYVWGKYILQRDWKPLEEVSQFEKFLSNITGNSKERLLSAMSALGYLLVGYKDRRSPKVIIFCDEVPSELDSGRNGKGMIGQAMGHIREVVTLNGKTFSPSRNFAWQEVKLTTRIIDLDDIQGNLNFRKMFSTITDDFTIEEKYKNPVKRTYDNSPKIAMTTNHLPKGLDGSSLHRQLIVEISDCYDNYFTVGMHFGAELFKSWDPDEWGRFDFFMACCIQNFQTNGLIPWNEKGVLIKRLINETSEEFYEWTKQMNLTVDVKYEKKELYDLFRPYYSDENNVSFWQFSKWLTFYSVAMGYGKPQLSQSGPRKFITFMKRKERKKEEMKK